MTERDDYAGRNIGEDMPDDGTDLAMEYAGRADGPWYPGEVARNVTHEDNDFPTHCWCGEPVQPASRPWPESSDGLDHRCRQCARHCEIAKYEADGGTF